MIVTDSIDGRAIGTSRFHGYNEDRGEIEIGWTFLARTQWGGTHNKELKQLMLRYALRFVNRVRFFVGAQNIRSQRVMKKIGGVHVESRQGADGSDNWVYEITGAKFAQGERT